MSEFWSGWLRVWCWSVIAFGVVLATGAFAATDAAVRALYEIFGGSAVTMAPPLRFSIALMGCVTIGWGLTLLAATRAATLLGSAGAPVWRMITISAVTWFVIDSALSIATGFALNAVSNTVYLAAYLLPVIASGVLAGRDRAPRSVRA